VTVEASLSEEEVEAVQKEADAKGKADWKMDLELKDKSDKSVVLCRGMAMRRM